MTNHSRFTEFSPHRLWWPISYPVQQKIWHSPLTINWQVRFNVWYANGLWLTRVSIKSMAVAMWAANIPRGAPTRSNINWYRTFCVRPPIRLCLVPPNMLWSVVPPCSRRYRYVSWNLNKQNISQPEVVSNIEFVMGYNQNIWYLLLVYTLYSSS